MGWLALFGTMVMAFAAMLGLRVSRRMWSTVGAALMLGATGYALQGHPMQPAAPAQAGSTALVADPALIDLRGQMFGRFGEEGAYMTAADALSRTGSPVYEVQAILGGIRRTPGSVQLWTALGDALARHDRQLSPAARLAFDQAQRLGPREPGPAFFRGVAQMRFNDLAGADASWRRALTLTPADAPYRVAIVRRLDMLTRLRAMVER